MTCGYAPKLWDNGGGREVLTHLDPGLTPSREGLAMKATPTLCSMPDCDKNAHARTWCQMHYRRWKTHGDPDLGAKIVRASVCQAGDCVKPVGGGGVCEMHRARMSRTGTYAERVTPERSLSSSGYWVVRRVGHPVAVSDGRAYEHRVALFDAIGGGEHQCNWCAIPVSWDRSYPAHSDALVVDHLDEDKLNNDPSNLVPSCPRCNIARSSRWKKRVV